MGLYLRESIIEELLYQSIKYPTLMLLPIEASVLIGKPINSVFFPRIDASCCVQVFKKPTKKKENEIEQLHRSRIYLFL